MARKAVRAKRAVKAPGGYTTLPVGEEGIPHVQGTMTTMMVGEEGTHHPTTLIAGEEHILTTMVYGEEHPIPSIPLAEHPPSDLSAEIGPIFHPGDPVEQQAALAAKKTAARKRRT
jgi:hypothetical protein